MNLTLRLAHTVSRSSTGVRRASLAKSSAIRNMAHTNFPSNLPKPVDDGSCDHLTNFELPIIRLPPTSNPEKVVDISKLTGLSIIFCYPRTGAPDEVVPAEWDAIPGARGCTPQACSFREYLPDLKRFGVTNLFGCSTQDSAYQQEVHDRIHLPYDLLSDEKLELMEKLKLPYFEYKGKKLIKRLSIAIEDGKIVKYWYPIFPPDSNVHEVLAWLKARQ